MSKRDRDKHLMHAITYGQSMTGRFSGAGQNITNIPKQNMKESELFTWPSSESIDELIWQKAFNDMQMNMLEEHDAMVKREAKLEQLLLNQYTEDPWVRVGKLYGQSLLHPSNFAYVMENDAISCLEASLKPSPQMELDFRTWRQKAWDKRKLLTSFIQTRGKSKKKGGRYDNW